MLDKVVIANRGEIALRNNFLSFTLCLGSWA